VRTRRMRRARQAAKRAADPSVRGSSSPGGPPSLYRAVRASIARKAGSPVQDVRCPTPIDDYVTDVQKKNLAPPFQEIAQQYRPKAVITEADTAALDDVLSAYNLVGQRAGFKQVTCSDVPPLPE
jgi:hypothetical protein